SVASDPQHIEMQAQNHIAAITSSAAFSHSQGHSRRFSMCSTNWTMQRRILAFFMLVNARMSLRPSVVDTNAVTDSGEGASEIWAGSLRLTGPSSKKKDTGTCKILAIC